MHDKKVDMIVDLQYGSTGKGLIAGYMAERYGYDLCVTANMPNAGHTYIDPRGNKFVHKVLPSGVVGRKCQVALIGPGSIFDLQRLLEEVEVLESCGYDHFVVGIHPNAVPLQEEHVEAEKVNVVIGSTMQGSGAAMAHKIARPVDRSVIAADILGYEPITDRIKVLTHGHYARALRTADQILAEGSQGYSLGINGPFYPYCTSRDCTPGRFLSDMAIPHAMLGRVLGVARLHPIRVGSPEGGHSGPGYPDQSEISWDDLGVEPETTTVTGRVRRVFTFSGNQIRDAINDCCPDGVFLNFCNYHPGDAYKIKEFIKLNGSRVIFTGWGPRPQDIRQEAAWN